MAAPKPNATLYFTSGDHLDVVETCAAIAAAAGWVSPPPPPAVLVLTKPDVAGTKVWVNVRTIERIEAA